MRIVALLNKELAEKIMDAVGLKPGMAIGEVGTGYGRFTVRLAITSGPRPIGAR